MREEVLVCYCDGSANPNPGYGGYGVFGYTLKPSKKPKNVNYPPKNGLQFTDKGILEKKQVVDNNYECINIIERIKSIDNDSATNNQAELSGVLETLKIALSIETVGKVLIICDSKYALDGLDGRVITWSNNNWVTTAGTPVKNRELWEELLSVVKQCDEKGITIETTWVKGHNGDPGNEIVDMYAVIASNYAKNQIEDGNHYSEIHTDCLSKTTLMSDFKKELDERSFIYDYKSAFFSSGQFNDSDMLMLACPPTSKVNIGKRDLESTYALLVGDIPNHIKSLKTTFRNIKREFDVMSIINLDMVKSDKILNRVINLVGYEPVITKYKEDGKWSLMTFDKDGVLVDEVDKTFNFIHEVHDTYNRLEQVVTFFDMFIKNGDDDNFFKVTDTYINSETKDLNISYSDKMFDITDTTQIPGYKIISRMYVTVGKDTPMFSTIKDLLPHIKDIYYHVDVRGNQITLSTLIQYEKNGIENILVHTNLLDKFLVSVVSVEKL